MTLIAILIWIFQAWVGAVFGEASGVRRIYGFLICGLCPPTGVILMFVYYILHSPKLPLRWTLSL